MFFALLLKLGYVWRLKPIFSFSPSIFGSREKGPFGITERGRERKRSLLPKPRRSILRKSFPGESPTIEISRESTSPFLRLSVFSLFSLLFHLPTTTANNSIYVWKKDVEEKNVFSRFISCVHFSFFSLKFWSNWRKNGWKLKSGKITRVGCLISHTWKSVWQTIQKVVFETQLS